MHQNPAHLYGFMLSCKYQLTLNCLVEVKEIYVEVGQFVWRFRVEVRGMRVEVEVELKQSVQVGAEDGGYLKAEDN